MKIPVLDRLVALAPPALDEDSLTRLASLVETYHLWLYKQAVSDGGADLPRIARLYRDIASLPGVLQADIAPEWPRASHVLYVAERLKIVNRTRAGRTYSLTMRVDPSRRPLR